MFPFFFFDTDRPEKSKRPATVGTFLGKNINFGARGIGHGFIFEWVCLLIMVFAPGSLYNQGFLVFAKTCEQNILAESGFEKSFWLPRGFKNQCFL